MTHLMTSKEAADYCRYSFDHWRDLQAAGLTPALATLVNVKHTYRYREADLIEWCGLPERTVEAVQAIVSRSRFRAAGRAS